jgi:hypothetical protein
VRPRPAPLLVRRYAHASIRDMVTACAPAGPCPVCFGAGVRQTMRGVSQICECTSYSMALALEWNLPQYAPDGYVSDEDE